MRRSSALALAAALLASPACAFAYPAVGKPAPDFRAVTLDGETVSYLQDLRGEVVVLNFWATWCGPCKNELPLLDAYFRVQRSHGFQVLAVTTEDSLPVERLKPLQAKLSLPLLRRFSGPYRDMGAIPTNYVIDRAGVVRYAKAAAFTLDDLNALLLPLLREPAPEAAAPVATARVSEREISPRRSAPAR